MMQTEEDKKRKKAEYHKKVQAKKDKEKRERLKERLGRSLLNNEKFWVKIPKYGDKYRINKKGHVFRITDMKFVVPCINDTGYVRINLNKNGKVVQNYLHRVVADAFLGGVSKDDRVEFLDNNTLNVNASNLIVRKKGTHRYHKVRTTREAEEKILSRGKIKEIVLWLSEDGEYHDQRTPFVAKCFNNHIINGNYWDWGGKSKASGCKYCVRNIPQTHYEAERMLYDSGVVKDILYFHTESGRYTNPTNKVTYLCFNDHLNTKTFADQRYSRRGCKFCSHRSWMGWSQEDRFSDNDIACSLYVCKFRGHREVFYKIGISRQGAERRFFQEGLKNYGVEVKIEFVMGSSDAYQIEQNILSRIHALGWKHTPRYTFGGSSECFQKYFYLDVEEAVEDMIFKKLIGEEHPSNKLSIEAVKFIKSNCVPGDQVKGVRNLSRMFKVHPKTIYNIVQGHTWKEVTPYYDVKSNV